MRSRVALLAFVLGLAWGAAQAGSTAVGPAIQTSNDRWAVWFGQAPPSAGRSYAQAAGGVGVAVSDTVKATLPSGTAVTLTASRTVGQAAIRAAMRTAVSGGIPGLIVTTAIPMIWDALKDQGIDKGPDGVPLYDPGQPKTGIRKWQWYQDGQYYRPDTLGGKYAEGIRTQCENTTSDCRTEGPSCVVEGGTVVRCTFIARGYRTVDGPGGLAGSYIGAWGGTLIAEQWTDVIDCPATTKPELSRTYGSPCASDNRAPATPGVIEEAANGVPNSKMPGIVEDLTKAGPQAGLPTSESHPSVQGPVSVDDPNPQVTTRPDGSTETKTRRWDLEYPGDGTVRFSPRTITVDGRGGTTVETGGTPQIDSRTDCDKYPSSIGCSEYGNPETGEVPRTAKQVSFEPVELAGGSCPADVTFQVGGHTYTLEFQPVCEGVETYVRPLVLVLGAFLAVAVFVGGLKS